MARHTDDSANFTPSEGVGQADVRELYERYRATRGNAHLMGKTQSDAFTAGFKAALALPSEPPSQGDVEGRAKIVSSKEMIAMLDDPTIAAAVNEKGGGRFS